MKKSIYIMLLLFSIVKCFSLSSLDDFKELSTQVQIDTLITEYKNNDYGGIDFSLKSEIIAANPAPAIDYIIKILPKYKAKPIGMDNNVINVINQLLFDFYELDKYSNEEKILNNTVKEILANEYQVLIDNYLTEYNIIDLMLMNLDMSLYEFKNELYPSFNSGYDWFVYLLNKYTKLGYQGLIINDNDVW